MAQAGVADLSSKLRLALFFDAELDVAAMASKRAPYPPGRHVGRCRRQNFFRRVADAKGVGAGRRAVSGYAVSRGRSNTENTENTD